MQSSVNEWESAERQVGWKKKQDLVYKEIEFIFDYYQSLSVQLVLYIKERL